MVLEFSVSHQKIIWNKKLYVVSGSECYLDIDVDFSHDWDGMTKTATFRKIGSADVYDVVMDNGVCRIPNDVAKAPGFVVCITGKLGDTVIITNSEKISVVKNGFEDTQDIDDSGGGSGGGTIVYWSNIVGKPDIDGHMENTKNPHKVSAQQVGVERITNSDIEDLF